VSYAVRLERAAPAAPEPDAGQEVLEELEWQVAESHGEFGRVVIHNRNVSFPL
jgi:hypothetical protein